MLPGTTVNSSPKGCFDLGLWQSICGHPFNMNTASRGGGSGDDDRPQNVSDPMPRPARRRLPGSHIRDSRGDRRRCPLWLAPRAMAPLHLDREIGRMSTTNRPTGPSFREFDLGDILSITDGALVSPRHIDGVYDILNYMTGDNLFTHQLPRAPRECQGPLLAQHPQLSGVGVPEDVEHTKEAVYAWLDSVKAIHGSTLPVRPLTDGEHDFRDPIAEADQMMGNRPVVVVHADDFTQGM